MIVSEKVKIEVKMNSTSQEVVEMDEVLFYKWGLSQKKAYRLQCGEQIKFVTFEPANTKQSLRMDESLRTQLHLPKLNYSLQLHYHERLDLFSLGIFIGLLTEIKKTDEGVRFGSVHDFCEEIATYCAQNEILFFVLSLNDKHSDPMQGYIWNGKGWELQNVPWPHVVHNRIHSRKKEQSTDFQAFISHLKEKQIPFFNDHFLNKWESYQHLVKQEHLLPYLPHTELLLNFHVFEQFILNYESVFIKPIHGSQGRKIFRIERRNEEYILDYTTFTGEMEKNYETIRDLFQAIRSRLKGAFIIQQGIPLLTYQNRVVDFRFLCHLNAANKWQVTSSVARISSPQDFVSNIARGGEIEKVPTLLKELLELKDAIMVNKLLHELAIEIASSIARSEVGLFGEFGIDLAIDKKGKPWIIEVNTKPSKNMDPSSTKASVRPSAKSIIHYCLYLANPFRGVSEIEISRFNDHP